MISILIINIITIYLSTLFWHYCLAIIILNAISINTFIIVLLFYHNCVIIICIIIIVLPYILELFFGIHQLDDFEILMIMFYGYSLIIVARGLGMKVLLLISQSI